MIQQRSRLPAVMMLLALLAFGVGMGFARKGVSPSKVQAEIVRLKAEVAKPNAKWQTWLEYGNALRDGQQYVDAILAYDQVLKADPYQKDARLQGSLCRATLGSRTDADKEGFLKFMGETVELDPRLAKAIFERPDIASFLSDERFRKLNKTAIDQSQD